MATDMNAFPIQKLAELLQEKDDDSELENSQVKGTVYSALRGMSKEAWLRSLGLDIRDHRQLMYAT